MIDIRCADTAALSIPREDRKSGWFSRVSGCISSVAKKVSDGAGRVFHWLQQRIPSKETRLQMRVVASGYSSFLFAKENRPKIVCSALIELLTNALNFCVPLLMGRLIATLQKGEKQEMVLGVATPLWMFGAVLVTIKFFQSNLLPNKSGKVLVTTNETIAQNLIMAMVRHLSRKSLNYHKLTPFADKDFLVQKCFSVAYHVTHLLPQFASSLLNISIACTILSVRYGAIMGLSALALMIADTAFSIFSADRVKESNEAAQTIGNRTYDEFIGALKNYEPMWNCCQFERKMDDVGRKLREMKEAIIRAEFLGYNTGLAHGGISHLYLLIILSDLLYGVQTGRYRTDDFVTVFAYVQFFSSKVSNFGELATQLIASFPAMRLVFCELAKPDEIVDLHPDAPFPADSGAAPSIQFENVAFHYPAKPNEPPPPLLFNGVSLTVRPGERVALISPSGCGKTTLLNILFRHFPLSGGRILINGKDITEIGLTPLRQNICMMGQDPYLFNDSVRENILYGARCAETLPTDEQILELAETVGLREFLCKECLLGADVGEDGRSVSGGQKSKIAILQKLVKGGWIQLLDEVTTGLDSRSAQRVMQGLCRPGQKKTTLFITHNLTEARKWADRIIVLGDGGVLAEGAHEELLGKCPLYKDLWNAYMAEEGSIPHSGSSENESRTE